MTKEDKEAYEKFFKSALKKFGVDSPADFKSDEEKKKFFDYVDKNYKGENEKSEEVKEETLAMIRQDIFLICGQRLLEKKKSKRKKKRKTKRKP